MFCSNCGKQLMEGARFCAFCGSQVGGGQGTASDSIPLAVPAKMVAAKCTYCGGSLNVNPSMEAAVCPYCNTAFIVDKAIQNYNISVSGNMNIANATVNVINKALDADNYVKRAGEYERSYNFIKAREYYNKALDIDCELEDARNGLIRAEFQIANFVFMHDSFAKFGANPGTLSLKYDKLVFEPKKRGKTVTFDMECISNPESRGMWKLRFDYLSSVGVTGMLFECNQAKVWAEAISKAKAGIYEVVN